MSKLLRQNSIPGSVIDIRISLGRYVFVDGKCINSFKTDQLLFFFPILISDLKFQILFQISNFRSEISDLRSAKRHPSASAKSLDHRPCSK